MGRQTGGEKLRILRSKFQSKCPLVKHLLEDKHKITFNLLPSSCYLLLTMRDSSTIFGVKWQSSEVSEIFQ